MGDKPDRPNESTEGNGSLIGIIVGSVVGVLVLIGVIGFVLYKKKNSALKKNLESYETL